MLVGACAQFRPLLMLIVIAALGITPAAFATGIGSDIQRPLATVILGGLISPTLVIAFVALPAPCRLAKRNETPRQEAGDPSRGPSPT